MERTTIGDVIALQSLKDWLYIDTTDFDAKLAVCLASAVAAAENYTGLTLNISQYALSMPFSKKLLLPVHPVTEVSQLAVDGESIDLSKWSLESDNIIFDKSICGSVVDLTVKAGKSAVEQDILTAVLLMAADLFQNPVDAVRQLPTMSRMLLQPYKYYNL